MPKLPFNTLRSRGGSSHLIAVLQALLVTFLWSTSWVLIKIGLDDLPALTFAGMRYTLAALLLLPFGLRNGRAAGLRKLSWRGWGQLILLGLVYYTINQGTLFVALDRLPAVTISLLLNFSAVLVAIFGILWLHELLSPIQWAGIGLFLLGVIAYFGPEGLQANDTLGLIMALAAMAATAGASLLGRAVNRQQTLHPMAVTIVSMGLGAPLLLVTGLLLEEPPALSLQSWLIIGWLAVVNTAFAFTLWNQTLRLLPAVESSLINNTMLIQIALLAWVFLGERLTAWEIGALVVAAVGVVLVQLRGKSMNARQRVDE